MIIYLFFFTWIKLSISQFERRIHYYCYYLVIFANDMRENARLAS